MRDVGVVPPLPPAITPELLNSRCTITNDRRKIKETHRLVFVPAKLDGTDFTILLLRKLAQKAGKGAQFFEQNWYYDDPFAKTSIRMGIWVLMPEVDLPSSRDKDYAAQEKELEKHPNYRTAKALELVTALVMNSLKNGEKLYPNFYGWCEDESALGRRVYCGYFHASGLYVYGHGVGNGYSPLGRAVLRKF